MANKRFGKQLSKKQLRARTPGVIKHILDLKAIRSTEYFVSEKGESSPVLDSVDLDIECAQIWAITGDSAFALSRLLAIAANILPFHSGMARVCETDLPQRPGSILPDLFYIDTTDMLYDDMNVLEFIAFATRKAKRLEDYTAAASQKLLLDFLIGADLAYIALSRIAFLSPEEKLLITMVCAYYSYNSFIIINQPEMQLTGHLRQSFALLLNKMKEQEQAVLFSTKSDTDLIGLAADYTAVLHNGKVIYQGETAELLMEYDRIAFIVKARHPRYVSTILTDLLPDYSVEVEDRLIYIRNLNRAGSPDDMEIEYLYAQIREAELWVEQVHINQKTVKQAVKELIHLHDLSIQQL